MTTPRVHPKIVLASSSPRRRQLLAHAGVDFEVDPPQLPEPCQSVAYLSPRQQAEALAYFKARSVAGRHHGRIVLGADTIAAAGKDVLGKPADAADARRMLRTLTSEPHVVITGISLVGPGPRRLIASEVTGVTMRPLSEDELDQYIDSGEWVGKAGAYGIQESADAFVQALDGSYANVVGLPVETVTQMLEIFRRDCDGQPREDSPWDA